jgi:hypothetical protein
MKQIVLETLESITKGKQEARRSPDFTLDIEFKEEITRKVKDALIELWKEKKVKFGRTINNNYIKLQ